VSVARIASRAQVGLAAPRVDVEVNLAAGLPSFGIVGLPAAAVKESKERVRAALTNCDFEFPAGRITVNLSPADLPKEGGRFDLPIALGILAASGQLEARDSASGGVLDVCEIYGELGLGGELKPVSGLLLAAAQAAVAGRALVVPAGNAAEAALAGGARVFAASHLLDVCAHLRGERSLAPALAPPWPQAGQVAAEGAGGRGDTAPDLADVCGQPQGKRALAIAAAGGHSLLMIGPPGAGKSMLAQRLPGILPLLSDAEALEVATIASVNGRTIDALRLRTPPFRSPHHTASAHAIVGGGPRARPGEVSLAHRGVLFLDELPEFDRRVLEALREPLENGVVTISRAAGDAVYPARFQLIAAMNPCPCGFASDASGRCRCGDARIERYRARISGPLLDRIDLCIEVPAAAVDDLAVGAPVDALARGECSATIGEQVRAARARQQARAGRLNAHLGVRDLARDCVLPPAAARLLGAARTKLRLSMRGVHRLQRVARTIADLAGSEAIAPEHLAEAIQLRRAIGARGEVSG
jgi:magnesium chelatase family protein